MSGDSPRLSKAEMTLFDPTLGLFVMRGAGVIIRDGTIGPPCWLAENVRNADGRPLGRFRVDAVYIEVRHGGKIEFPLEGAQGATRLLRVHPSGYDVVPESGNRLATTLQLTATNEESGISVTRLLPLDRDAVNTIAGLPDPSSKTALKDRVSDLYPMFEFLNAISENLGRTGRPRGTGKYVSQFQLLEAFLTCWEALGRRPGRKDVVPYLPIARTTLTGRISSGTLDWPPDHWSRDDVRKALQTFPDFSDQFVTTNNAPK